MSDLVQFINLKLEGKYSYLKLFDAIYYKEKNMLEIVFLYPDEVSEITEENRKEIYEIVEKYLDTKLNFTIKYKKSFVGFVYLKNKINKYIRESYPALSTCINTQNMKLNKNTDGSFNIVLHYAEGFVSEDYVLKFEKALKTFLNSEFCYIFNLEVKQIAEKTSENVLEQRKQEVLDNLADEVKPVEFEILKTEIFIGSKITQKPICMSEVKAPGKGVAIVATAKYINPREFTKKIKVVDENGVEGFKEEQKTFYSLLLTARGKDMNAVYFPTKDFVEKAKQLRADEDVLLFGDVDEYNGKLSFKIRYLSYCELVRPKEEEEMKRPIPKKYVTIKPQPVEIVGQTNLFEVVEEENKYLRDNDFIVFDLETTGLDAETCNITEIGAVKISGGHVTEQFSSLINPEEPISAEITKITGITDEMVKDKPTIDKVIPDFYKFCDNAILVAYNIPFDYKFLSNKARKSGYSFDHKQADALVMARQKIGGLRSYKLIKVAEYLNVPLVGAHRAVNDAIATAKVFIKLVKEY